jgi:hypothetical protein
VSPAGSACDTTLRVTGGAGTRAFLAWCVVFAAALGVRHAAAAGADRSYSVAYEGPASCPSRQAFLDAVAARAPAATLSASEAALEFDVRLAEEGPLARGTLSVHFATGEHFAREIPPAACEDVTTSLAIIAGLLLSGALLPEPASSPLPTSEDLARQGADPPPLGPVHAVPAAHAEPSRGGAPVSHLEPPPPAQERGRLRAGLFADARLDFGVAPFPAFGVVSGLEARLDRRSWFSPSARAGVVYVGGDASKPPLGGARLELLAATLRACPLGLAFTGRLRLDGCALFEGGVLTASPRATPGATGDVAMPWLAVGAAVRAEARVAGPVGVEAELSGFGLVRHDAFALEPGRVVVHDVPPFSGALSLGFVARWP